jgi:diacylglycerol kinase (ATP)
LKTYLGNKILFVINLTSGIGTAKDFYAVIADFAEEKKFQWKIYETTGKNDSDKIRRRINEFQPDIVFAVGGDGTVNMVATELINKNIILGIIPAGSANGLAFNLGITGNLELAFKKSLEATPIEMDAVKINGKYLCFHLGDIGVNARIVSRFEKEGSKGMLGYGKHLLREMFERKPSFYFYVQVPGHRRKKMRAEMLVIANAKRYGTGAIINPTGKIDDGKFEIIILRPYPWWFIFTFVYAVFLGKLHKMRYIKVYSAPEAQITFLKSHEFQSDGEIIPEIRQIKAKIIPGALKVLGYKPNN